MSILQRIEIQTYFQGYEIAKNIVPIKKSRVRQEKKLQNPSFAVYYSSFEVYHFVLSLVRGIPQSIVIPNCFISGSPMRLFFSDFT